MPVSTAYALLMHNAVSTQRECFMPWFEKKCGSRLSFGALEKMFRVLERSLSKVSEWWTRARTESPCAEASGGAAVFVASKGGAGGGGGVCSHHDYIRLDSSDF